MVSDRTAIARTVLTSLSVHGAEVSDELEKILFPAGPPVHLTVAHVLTALGATIERATRTLTEADLANAAELADDEAPRTARDQGIIDLRSRLITIRGALSSAFGNGILGAYGLSGETPEDADLLVHRARSVADLLATRALVEKPRQEGITVDAVVLGLSLAKPIAHLDAALADVKREEREAQLTLKARNEAALVWNTRYQGVADAVTGIFEMVGHTDLAERVRPTARRRAGVAEPVDLPATPHADPAPKG
ncbi:MAG: hypothetical protein ABJE95_32970 [Byssovorax sp.]